MAGGESGVYREKPADKWLIFSDCLSSLKASQNVFSEDPLVWGLLEELARVKEHVIFLWVPGYNGNQGNENSIEAARSNAEILSLLESKTNCYRLKN